MTKTIILLVSVYILNVIDYVQTMYAIQEVGLAVELNPIMQFLYQNNFVWPVKLVMPVVLLVIWGFIIKADKRLIWSVYILFAVYLFVVFNNFIVSIKLGLLY